MTFALRTKTAIGAMLALALGFAALLAAGPGAPAANAGGGCANADAQPNEATPKQFRQAVVCLIQIERLSRGKNELGSNRKLRAVAGDHNAVMLSQDCFEHQCAGEGSLTKRLKQIGYLKGDSWAYAENIGYENTPREMVDAWMGDNYHRNNILNNKWVDIGVGAGKGTPNPNKPDSQFVTYTVEFGDGG